MSQHDWHFIGFLLTVGAAGVLWSLAVVVYRNNRSDYMNRMLSLTMLFMGIWFLSGFAEKMLPTPSNAFTLWTFRWAYASGVMTTAFFLMFTLGLYLNRSPGRALRMGIVVTGACAACACLSPLVVTGATYSEGVLTSETGPAFFLVSGTILLFCLASVYLIVKKWTRSTGIDRARTSVVLYGIVIFLPVAAVSIFVLPAVLGNDVSSSYAYVFGLIPVGFTSYAVVRLRLLDTRIILRRTSVFLVGTALLSLPVVLLLMLFRVTRPGMAVQYSSLLLVFMVMMFFSQDIWKRIHRLSARLFFSELYDEAELLEGLSSKLAARTDPNAGLMAALEHVVCPLGLDGISVVIPPGVVNDKCWDFECRQEADGSAGSSVNGDCHFMPWLDRVDSTVVTEELQRWPRGPDEKRLGENLCEAELSACLPLRVAGERKGYLLPGGKVAGKALSSTDISFLEKAAELMGIYIDNYALSTRLALQLDELRIVYGDLHKACDFKSEIIQVASHEFRTPITVIDGFMKTLMANWNEFTDEEKVEYMASVTSASRRLMNLTDKFLNISALEAGDISFVKVPTRLNGIVKSLCAELRDQDLQRLIIDGNPEMYVVSDPNHLNVMLHNLVENAFRFSPADASVVLRIWRDSAASYIQVQDFGKGIPLEEREKVFEPFVRLESLSNHSKGMGLGLHIVRLLSSRLGIEVEIDSGIGSGTTVTLSFALE